jgi:hypothetical protein
MGCASQDDDVQYPISYVILRIKSEENITALDVTRYGSMNGSIHDCAETLVESQHSGRHYFASNVCRATSGILVLPRLGNHCLQSASLF